MSSVPPSLVASRSWPPVRRVLARAREGTGGVALIVGEAGVGKSRLLRAMTDEARSAGFFVLHGACFEAERSIPYAPLLDLVRLFAGSASPGSRRSRARAGGGRARDDLPGARTAVSRTRRRRPRSIRRPDKRRLFHALAQVTTLLARTQPVLLAFEDVHWSDDATLELIFHLARSSQLAAGRHRADVSRRGSRTAGSRDSSPTSSARASSTELPVERLGRDDVGAMLQAIFGPREHPRRRVRASAARAHGGQPVLRRGDAQVADRRWRPRADRRWVARATARARARPEDCRRGRAAPARVAQRPARDVASTAAVAGRRFDFGLLQTLTNHDETRACSRSSRS